MNKTIINVPASVTYLADLTMDDGSHFELPNGILNKGLTGCGATTMALTDNHKTIVCSPRVKLMECKQNQHKNMLIVKKGVTGDDIAQYISKCEEQHLVPKIMTTYDSFRKIAECMDMKDVRVVVDEFHCLCNDSTFKADVEFKFLELLSTLPYVTYLSATPIPEDLLSQIEPLKDIPYYELQWENHQQVEVVRHRMNSPISIIPYIIQVYQEGKSIVRFDKEGNEVQSTEAVIYVNSVTIIINIIKQCNLKADEVNIIVAKNDDNDKFIQQLGEDYTNGTFPLKGEPHKMFTFCTSTAYFGCDMYSTNACQFVISDCSRPNTSIDISTELTQIAGRLRLDENPFKNLLFLYYKVNIDDVDEQQFMQTIHDKTLLTQQEVDLYNLVTVDPLRSSIIKKIKDQRTVLNYSSLDTYTMYDETTDSFKINQLARVSELWMYKAQVLQYQCGNLVDEQLTATGVFTLKDKNEFVYVPLILTQTLSNNAFAERMKWYIKLRTSNVIGANASANKLAKDYPELKVYYDALGPSYIARLGYKESKLKEAYQLRQHHDDIYTELHREFASDTKATANEIKSKVSELYKKYNINTSLTAQELTNYGFTIINTKTYRDDHRVSAYLIKEEEPEQ